jgi:hypothetical protein
MLGPSAQQTQLGRWYERLAALVAQTRASLRAIPPEDLVWRSGCTLDSDGALCLDFWGEPYRVTLPDVTVQHQGGTEAAPSDFTQALLLTYLATADGTAPADRWITYRDLPDGMFYAQAFRGYAEMRLVRELGAGGIAAFRRGMEALDGQPEAIGSGEGNAAYSVQVLPCVRLAAVYWLGDEDFPSQASVLFQETAPHYLSTDGLAVLGSHLVNRILEGARQLPRAGESEFL